jgi:hypothetical protein
MQQQNHRSSGSLTRASSMAEEKECWLPALGADSTSGYFRPGDKTAVSLSWREEKNCGAFCSLDTQLLTQCSNTSSNMAQLSLLNKPHNSHQLPFVTHH